MYCRIVLFQDSRKNCAIKMLKALVRVRQVHNRPSKPNLFVVGKWFLLCCQVRFCGSNNVIKVCLRTFLVKNVVVEARTHEHGVSEVLCKRTYICYRKGQSDTYA